jgi:N-acetyl-gamma-glutamyl-phosphate reductase
MISCAIVGATGYAGTELTRLLLGHPEVGPLALSSSSQAGEEMAALYPNLAKSRAARLVSQDEAIAASEIVFASMPHGHAESIAAACTAKGALFIDLSADFRFGKDEATFAAWYGSGYARPQLHAASVYGLPELNRPLIAKSRIVANPGCYPTCASLALFPALRLALDGDGVIVIDAKSGVTGAGKEPTKGTHFPECAESIAPYKLGAHRHAPEIAANLAVMAARPVASIFAPHLVPMNRGILCTCYLPLAPGVDVRALREACAEFYADEPFVRVLPEGMTATTRNVRFSNFCDVSVHESGDGRVAIVASAIDNMVKGAAGQAVQNMNIALGLDEGAGLGALPPAF